MTRSNLHRTGPAWRLAASLSLMAVAGIGLSSPAAHAGYYLEHQTEMPDPNTRQMQTHKVRSWHEGKKFKRENPMRNETVIIDLDNNRVYGINEEKKTYWEVTPDKYKQLAIVSLIVMGVQVTPEGGVRVPDGLLEPTGKVQTINGHQSYEVRVKNGLPPNPQMTMETTFWLSEDVQIPIEKMIDELRLALNNPQDPEYKRLFKQWRAMSGYPVQSVTKVTTPQGELTTRETLVAYKRRKIPDSEFIVPKGFKKTIDPITQLEQMGKQFQQRMKEQQAAGNTGAPGAPAANRTKKRVLPAGKK